MMFYSIISLPIQMLVIYGVSFLTTPNMILQLITVTRLFHHLVFSISSGITWLKNLRATLILAMKSIRFWKLNLKCCTQLLQERGLTSLLQKPIRILVVSDKLLSFENSCKFLITISNTFNKLLCLSTSSVERLWIL